MTPDAINAGLSLGAGVFVFLSVRRLWIDGEVKGTSPWPVLYFSLVGIWNWFFYAHLGQVLSLVAGLFVTTMNISWLVLYVNCRRSK